MTLLGRVRVLAAGAVLAAAAVTVAGCTSSGSSKSPSTAGDSTVANVGTVPFTEPAAPTTEATTTQPTTTLPATTTSSTTTTSTLPGRGLAAALADGSPVPAPALATAQAIYAAIGSGDDEALRTVIKAGSLRVNVVPPGDGDLVQRMRAAASAGESDPLMAIRRLLEAPAGLAADGSVVWPGVAVKQPALWDAADEATLAELGFDQSQIAATRAKGTYLDERVVIAADGRWTGFRIGA